MQLFAWDKEGQGQAWIDRWTVVHLAFWLVVGANFEAVQVPHAWRWPIILVGALLWELTEELLQKVRPQMICTHEHWLNRWVSDPIMGFVGAGAGMYLISPLVPYGG